MNHTLLKYLVKCYIELLHFMGVGGGHIRPFLHQVLSQWSLSNFHCQWPMNPVQYVPGQRYVTGKVPKALIGRLDVVLGWWGGTAMCWSCCENISSKYWAGLVVGNGIKDDLVLWKFNFSAIMANDFVMFSVLLVMTILMSSLGSMTLSSKNCGSNRIWRYELFWELVNISWSVMEKMVVVVIVLCFIKWIKNEVKRAKNMNLRLNLSIWKKVLYTHYSWSCALPC